jgi:hypothetical protein
MDDYRHPESGRIYREGDPAHTYALACRAVEVAARELALEVTRHAGSDYLTRAADHPYQGLVRMHGTLDWIDKAYTDLLVDREFSTVDEEYQRKYGELP